MPPCPSVIKHLIHEESAGGGGGYFGGDFFLVAVSEEALGGHLAFADAEEAADQATHHLVEVAAGLGGDGDSFTAQTDVEATEVFDGILMFHALAMVGAEGGKVMPA